MSNRIWVILYLISLFITIISLFTCLYMLGIVLESRDDIHHVSTTLDLWGLSL